MSYLEDKEKRLLFSALSREKKVCEKVDKESCREHYETSLKSIVERLEYKFYYDRFEKEIYNKAIDDFCKEIETEYDNDACPNVSDYLDYKISLRDLFRIAEQLKG